VQTVFSKILKMYIFLFKMNFFFMFSYCFDVLILKMIFKKKNKNILMYF